MTETNVVDFLKAGGKHRSQRAEQLKENRAQSLRERFESALPDKPTPVKDYFKKKRSRKKR